MSTGTGKRSALVTEMSFPVDFNTPWTIQIAQETVSSAETERAFPNTHFAIPSSIAATGAMSQKRRASGNTALDGKKVLRLLTTWIVRSVVRTGDAVLPLCSAPGLTDVAIIQTKTSAKFAVMNHLSK